MIVQPPTIDFITYLAHTYFQVDVPFCPHLISSVVVVNFNEDSYTVAENVGQVSVSLRIDGKFFVPVWAIVEISEGTATGMLCKSTGYIIVYIMKLVVNLRMRVTLVS